MASLRHRAEAEEHDLIADMIEATDEKDGSAKWTALALVVFFLLWAAIIFLGKWLLS